MKERTGKLQKVALGLFDGTLKTKVVKRSGVFTTAEMLTEMQAYGMIAKDESRKMATYVVRRTCASLLNRGLVTGEYVIDPDHPWTQILEWRLAGKKRKS